MRFKVPVGPILVAAALAAVGMNCKLRQSDSDVATGKSAGISAPVKAFRSLIGRDPSQEEIRSLIKGSYEATIAAILSSQQFAREGFYRFHEFNLLLNRDDNNWQTAPSKSSEVVGQNMEDYCGLRFELEEAAEADRRSPLGYWHTLQYRERWIPLNDSMSELRYCLLQTTAADLLTGMSEIETPPKPDASGYVEAKAPEHAGRCARALKDQVRGKESEKKAIEQLSQAGTAGFQGPLDIPVPSLTRLLDGLRALPPSEMEKPLLGTAAGEELITTFLQASILPDYAGLAQRYGVDYRIKVATRGGAPEVRVVDRSSEGAQCEPKLIPHPEKWTWERDSSAPTSSEDPPGVLSGGDIFGTLYVKVLVPPAFAGVLGSGFWLSRHPSRQKNQHLHRAARVFDSYFCEKIAPDQATLAGGPPERLPEHEQFFDPGDKHKNAARLCYDCHLRVQPMANFFGLTSYGRQVGAQDYGLSNPLPDAFLRAAALKVGNTFVAPPPGPKGLGSLGALLASRREVRQCLVRRAWLYLMPEAYAPTDGELAAAETAFSKTGASRLHDLLQHFLVESERPRALHEKGEGALAKLRRGDQLDCNDFSRQRSLETETVLTTACGECHTDKPFDFFATDTDGAAARLDMDGFFTRKGVGSDPKARSEWWRRIYCTVRDGRMPQGGWEYLEPDTKLRASEMKRLTLCYFKAANDATLGAQNATQTAIECGTARERPSASAPHAIMTPN